MPLVRALAHECQLHLRAAGLGTAWLHPTHGADAAVTAAGRRSQVEVALAVLQALLQKQ